MHHKENDVKYNRYKINYMYTNLFTTEFVEKAEKKLLIYGDTKLYDTSIKAQNIRCGPLFKFFRASIGERTNVKIEKTNSRSQIIIVS